jgi:hypothetical protein
VSGHTFKREEEMRILLVQQGEQIKLINIIRAAINGDDLFPVLLLNPSLPFCPSPDQTLLLSIHCINGSEIRPSSRNVMPFVL